MNNILEKEDSMGFFGWLNKKINTFSDRRKRQRKSFYSNKKDFRQNKRFSSEKRVVKENLSEMPKPSEKQTVSPHIKTQNPFVQKQKQLFNQIVEMQQVKSKITIFYVDQNNQPLRKPDILVGFSGDTYHITLSKFKNHYLAFVDNFTTRFTDQDQEITFHYSLRIGQPIQIFYIDYDSRQIIKKTNIISGQIGTTYRVSSEEIPGFRPINSIGKTYGIFSAKPTNIVFLYRKNNWQTVQKVNYYVKLNTQHQVFSNPEGAILPTPIPQNQIIKVFASVKSTSKTTWLNIGGPEWIKNEQVEMSNPPENIYIDQMTKTSRSSSNLSGWVDFVDGKFVPLFNKPYGTMVNQIKNGTKIQIIATISDDQGLIWYELLNHTIISSSYVKINYEIAGM